MSRRDRPFSFWETKIQPTVAGFNGATAMPNTLLTPTEITRETLRLLHNNLAFIKNVNREYDDRFANSGASVSGKIGPTLQIRRPVQFTVRTGATLSLQDVVETKKDLTVSTLKGIDWEFSDTDLTLTIDKFSERYLKSAAARLATELDFDALSMYQQVWNQVGTPGTTPNTSLVYLQAGEVLDDSTAPRDGRRVVVINPAAQAATVEALKGLFQSAEKISEQYEKGVMGIGLGWKFLMDQSIRVHTVGPLGGTPLVNGANQGIASGYAETTSLVTDAWTAGAAQRLAKGDVFTIANVFQVNSETKQSVGKVQKFVVTADASSDGSGNLTAIVSPALIRGGAYQNINAAPADNAALTVIGTAATGYPINMAFHKEAFTFVSADLELPKGTDMASRAQSDGISLRFIRDYDVTNNRRISRFDVLYGFVAVRPEFACRIIG